MAIGGQPRLLYYAAFHTALFMVTQCGIRFGKSSLAHDKLAICLQRCGRREVEIAGAKLSSLRAARNDADYNLASRSFASHKGADVQITVAAEIIAAVDGQHADITLRLTMRQYARDTLRLVVVGDD